MGLQGLRKEDFVCDFADTFSVHACQTKISFMETGVTSIIILSIYISRYCKFLWLTATEPSFCKRSKEDGKPSIKYENEEYLF